MIQRTLTKLRRCEWLELAIDAPNCGSLNVEALRAVRAMLHAAIAATWQPRLPVSLRNVHHAGAEFVSILHGARQEADRRGVHLQLRDASPQIRGLLELCGLGDVCEPAEQPEPCQAAAEALPCQAAVEPAPPGALLGPVPVPA